MMKQTMIVLALLTLVSVCGAAGSHPSPRFQTGDDLVDRQLHQTNNLAATPDGAKQVRLELQQRYALQERQIDFLTKKGYTLGEVQYFAMLARESGKPVNDIAALHGQGVGWGMLAKRLGVKPSALHKLMVQEQKQAKEQHRETVRYEHQKRSPGFAPAGVDRGMGRGRGR